MKRIFSLSIASLILLAFTYQPPQHEELAQKVEAFIEEHSEDYEKKYLNIDDPEIGDIENTDHIFADRFMLKSKERVMSNLDREIYAKYYVNVYGYYDETERDYAMKHWLKNFIEDETIRPGRDKRSYEYATPTVIIINSDNIAVLNYECALFDRDSFHAWREKMLSYFGDVHSIVIEVECGGPLKWTKNPPDPTDRAWR